MTSRIEVGSIWLSPRTGAFALADEVESDGPREHVTRVAFAAPTRFKSAAPRVAVAFASLDLSGEYECAVRVVRVDRAGFDLAVGTAHQAIVYGVQVSWIAYENADDRAPTFQSGAATLFAAGDLAPLAVGSGMRKLATTVRFPVAFGSDVKLFLALSAVAGADDLKLSALAANLSGGSFELLLNAWGDTHLTHVSVVWFAYNEALEAATHDCRLLSGIAKVGKDRSGFRLHAGPPGPRSFDVPPLVLDAPPAAKAPPAMIAAVLGLAANAAEADVRFKTDVSAASARAASLSVGTWSDTKIDSGMVMWLASFDLPPAPAAAAAVAVAASSSSSAATKRRKASASSDDDNDNSDDDDDDGSGSSAPKAVAKKPPPKKPKAAPAKKGPSVTKKSLSALAAAAAGARPAVPAAAAAKAPASSAAEASTKVPAAAAAAAAATSERECCICFDGTVDAVLVPCGHVCCCMPCATLLAPKKSGSMSKSVCPICSAKIDMVVKTFMV